MATGKRRYSHGDIIEISLEPFAKLYAYVKYVDFSNWPDENIKDKVFYVFNFLTEKRTNESFNVSDLLCNPIRCFGNNSLVDGWNVIDNREVVSEEFLKMDLKSYRPLILDSEEDVKKLKWYCASNIEPTSVKFPCRHDEVRHLESTWEMHTSGLALRIYMEYCKSKNISIKHFQEFDYSMNVYLNCFDVPVFQKIPQQFRLKRCPEGISKYIVNKSK